MMTITSDDESLAASALLLISEDSVEHTTMTITSDDLRAVSTLMMLIRENSVEHHTLEERVFIRVPRRKRSFRVPRRKRSFYSSLLTSTVDSLTLANLEDEILKDLLTESPETPTNNKRKRLPELPQPKNAKRKIDHRLAGEEASSSGTREPAPEWLVQLMRIKNGVEPKKIIEKPLTATDINPIQGRLSMPFSQITDLGFLSPTEERIIYQHLMKIRKKGVDAKLVSSDLREFDVNLRRWDMKKDSGNTTHLYNLVTGWNQVVEDCYLQENQQIRLWSFHANDQLYFALVPPPSSSDDSGKSKSENKSSGLVIYDKTNADLEASNKGVF